MKDFKCVAVLGANGTMGFKSCGLFAAFGNAKTYMVCRKMEEAIKAKEKACDSIRSTSIAKRLIPATYDQLSMILPKCDLVYETVLEDATTKQHIFTLIKPFLHNGLVIATGTSGLSIEELALSVEKKYRMNFIGIHLFNPPYSMPLCELIPTSETSKELIDGMREYLRDKLRRTVIIVKDNPSFLANRIGFYLINKSLIWADKYKDNGGIDYIDSILGGFTGRILAPLKTADYIGLDIHKAIVDEIYKKTNDYNHSWFALPEYVNCLIKNNQLGAKTGQGLYHYTQNDGNPIEYVYDIEFKEYRLRKNYNFPFSVKMIELIGDGRYKDAIDILTDNNSQECRIALSFLLDYIAYAIYVATFESEEITSADDAMAQGFNWVPPFALIEAFGGVERTISLIQSYSMDGINCPILSQLKGMDIPSNYDYRKFFIAKER